jgi:hypothetical protein
MDIDLTKLWVTYYLDEGHTICHPLEVDDYYEFLDELDGKEEDDIFALLERKTLPGYQLACGSDVIIAFGLEPRIVND